MVAVFNRMGGIVNCSGYRAEEFLECGMKVEERVLREGFVKW